MPAALGAMALALWNGIVYVAGGSPDIGTSVVNTLYAYDIAAKTWTHAPPHATGLGVLGFGSHHTGRCTSPVAATVTPS